MVYEETVIVDQRCEICEEKPARYVCPEPPREAMYWCAEHLMEHLRDAHGWPGEAAAIEYMRQRSEIDELDALIGRGR